MAPMKRQRITSDDGGVEIIEMESVSSGLQQASRKKQRMSLNDHNLHSSPQASDEESFMEQASQYVTQQKTKSIASNTPADNGIIESVTMTNFMCHDYLTIQLGPLINFIIGHNGSGKSAILTAITICLGGKATATNRGGSLKSFIKNGQEHAMLSVKLKNTSESAYQQDLYGESIIVERQFSRSGSSNFKLKSSAGRIISTRKGDLEDVNDYFALQIDNPMNVLTQDMARQFLNNSTPYDKYKFFMKGTQLEHLDGDYILVEQNVDMIDADLYKKQEDLEIFTRKAREAEHLHRLSERNDELRQTIIELGGKMAWAQVEEQERILSHYDGELGKIDEAIARGRIHAEGVSEAYSQSHRACETANTNVEEAQSALGPFREEKEGVKAEHDKAKAEQIELQTQQREIANEIRAAETRIARVRKELEDEHRRLSDADGGMHAGRRAEIEEKRNDAQEAKIRIRSHEDDLPVLKDKVERAKAENFTCQSQIKQTRSELHKAEERLHTLERDRGQQQNAYPASMPRLLKAIHQDSEFEEKAIGPIGNHVQLLDPQWSSILEKQFGSALDSFIVTSKSDQIRLAGHMQRIKCVSPILIGNHSVLNTTGHEPEARFVTALRVLEINNDLVRKQLIVGQAIDQTILIEDRSGAIEVMNAGKLNNVKQCYTHNNKRGTGTRYGYSPGGGLSESYIPAFQGTSRMKTDIEYQISAQLEEVERTKAEEKELDQRLREKRNHLNQCEQAVVKHGRVASRLQIDSQQAQSILDELQDALDRDAVEEGRLDALKEQLVEAEGEKETHENSYQDSVVEKDKLFKALKEAKIKMTDLDKAIDEANTRLSKAETKAAQRANAREIALREKNAALEAVEIEEQNRQESRDEQEQQNATVTIFIEEANKVSPRVSIERGETYRKLEEKMKKMRADLAKSEKRIGGSATQIAANAAKASDALQRARAEVESVESLVQLLKTTLVERRERWKKFQKHITSNARIQFFYQLSERGFRGKLLANHREKKLDLQVEPDETRRNAKGRSTQGLSGGEKSYSTICLLLSMWEAMGAPIRALDEFDVFMDSVNRDISMEMMIRFARASVGKQFILITPQSMSKIDLTDPDIKVTKMRDPERGQKTLQFPVAVGS